MNRLIWIYDHPSLKGWKRWMSSNANSSWNRIGHLEGEEWGLGQDKLSWLTPLWRKIQSCVRYCTVLYIHLHNPCAVTLTVTGTSDDIPVPGLSWANHEGDIPPHTSSAFLTWSLIEPVTCTFGFLRMAIGGQHRLKKRWLQKTLSSLSIRSISCSDWSVKKTKFHVKRKTLSLSLDHSFMTSALELNRDFSKPNHWNLR